MKSERYETDRSKLFSIRSINWKSGEIGTEGLGFQGYKTKAAAIAAIRAMLV